MTRETTGLAQARDADREYRKLLARLAARARWLGSRDPESAAQEALKRSLENPLSQAAVEYYFSEELAPEAAAPAWPLDQLLAWLHGVLHFVVREEQSRMSTRREVLTGIGVAAADRDQPAGSRSHDPADPAPNPLDRLLEREMQQIVVQCLPTLDREYRDVLKLRARGLKYGEIASQMGVSENTIASWVSRGIKTLARCVRRRSERGPALVRIKE
jgi:RNA polymerase sigma factor (sigma-70 family)